MNDYLNSYIKVLDYVASFRKANENITQYQNDYSIAANTIVSELYTQFLNVMDACFTTEQSITEWCSLSTNLLTTFKKMFENASAAKFNMQKIFLNTLLDTGILKTNVNENVLFSNFENALTKVIALNRRLESDYRNGSEYYTWRVNLLRPTQDNHYNSQGSSYYGSRYQVGFYLVYSLYICLTFSAYKF